MVFKVLRRVVKCATTRLCLRLGLWKPRKSVGEDDSSVTYEIRVEGKGQDKKRSA